jgi:hypothetical protein
MDKRYYNIYIEKSTGRKVILDNDNGIRVKRISLSSSNVYTIQHNLETEVLLCIVTNSENEPIIIDQIKIIDINTLELTVSTLQLINVTLIA